MFRAAYTLRVVCDRASAVITILGANAGRGEDARALPTSDLALRRDIIRRRDLRGTRLHHIRQHCTRMRPLPLCERVVLASAFASL